MKKTDQVCCYCVHLCWSDPKQAHYCMDKEEVKELNDNCPKFKIKEGVL